MSDRLVGGCHCGAVRFGLAQAAVLRQSICHCRDCQRHSGAPMVAWLLAEAEGLTVAGELGGYSSSQHARWQFCPRCGTGLFYRNDAVFEGRVDIQSAAFDDPDLLPAPNARVQMAEAQGWARTIEAIPMHERYPES